METWSKKRAWNDFRSAAKFVTCNGQKRVSESTVCIAISWTSPRWTKIDSDVGKGTTPLWRSNSAESLESQKRALLQVNRGMPEWVNVTLLAKAKHEQVPEKIYQDLLAVQSMQAWNEINRPRVFHETCLLDTAESLPQANNIGQFLTPWTK